jgi:hypothetical protein
MFVGSYGLQRRIGIKPQAKSDGLQLLRAIDATQAHGQEGARVDPAPLRGLGARLARYHLPGCVS